MSSSLFVHFFSRHHISKELVTKQVFVSSATKPSMISSVSLQAEHDKDLKQNYLSSTKYQTVSQITSAMFMASEMLHILLYNSKC